MTKQPTHRYFIGFTMGSEDIETHNVDAEELKQLYKEEKNLPDDSEFEEWIFEEYLKENNFETWIEIKPEWENLKELQSMIDTMVEDLGGKE